MIKINILKVNCRVFIFTNPKTITDVKRELTVDVSSYE